MTDQNAGAVIIDLTDDNDHGSPGNNAATGNTGISTPVQQRRRTRRRRRPNGFLNSAGMDNTPIGVNVCDDPIDTVNLLDVDDDGDEGANENPTIRTDYIFNPRELEYPRRDNSQSGSIKPVKPNMRKRKKKVTATALAVSKASKTKQPQPPPSLQQTATSTVTGKEKTSQKKLPTTYRRRASSEGIKEKKSTSSSQQQLQQPPKIARYADIKTAPSVKPAPTQSEKKRRKQQQQQCASSQNLSGIGNNGSAKYQHTQMQVQVESAKKKATKNSPKNQKNKEKASKKGNKRKTADIVGRSETQEGHSKKKKRRRSKDGIDEGDHNHICEQAETVPRNNHGPTIQATSQKDAVLAMSNVETSIKTNKRRKTNRNRKERDQARRQNHKLCSNSTTVEMDPHQRQQQEVPSVTTHLDNKRKYSEVELEREGTILPVTSKRETYNERGKLQKFGNGVDGTQRPEGNFPEPYREFRRNHEPQIHQYLNFEQSKPTSVEEEARLSPTRYSGNMGDRSKQPRHHHANWYAQRQEHRPNQRQYPVRDGFQGRVGMGRGRGRHNSVLGIHHHNGWRVPPPPPPPPQRMIQPGRGPSFHGGRYFDRRGRGLPPPSASPNWREMDNHRPNHYRHEGSRRPLHFGRRGGDESNSQANLSNDCTKLPRKELTTHQQQSFEDDNRRYVTGPSFKTGEHAQSYRDGTNLWNVQDGQQHQSQGDSMEKVGSVIINKKSTPASTRAVLNLPPGITSEQQKTDSPSLTEQQRFADGVPGIAPADGNMELCAKLAPIERQPTDASIFESKAGFGLLECSSDHDTTTLVQKRASAQTPGYPWLREFVENYINGESEQSPQAPIYEIKPHSGFSKDSSSFSTEPLTTSNQADEGEKALTYEGKRPTFNVGAGEVASFMSGRGMCCDPTRDGNFVMSNHGPVHQQDNTPIVPERSIPGNDLSDPVRGQGETPRVATEHPDAEASGTIETDTNTINESDGRHARVKYGSKSVVASVEETDSSSYHQGKANFMGSDQGTKISTQLSRFDRDSTRTIATCKDDIQTNLHSMDRTSGATEQCYSQVVDDSSGTVQRPAGDKLGRSITKSIDNPKTPLEPGNTNRLPAVETKDKSMKQQVPKVCGPNRNDILSVGSKEDPVAAEIAYTDFVEGGRCSIFVHTTPTERKDEPEESGEMCIDGQGFGREVNSPDGDDPENSISANETMVTTDQKIANGDGQNGIDGGAKTITTSHITGLRAEQIPGKRQKEIFDKLQPSASDGDIPGNGDIMKKTSCETNTIDSMRKMENTNLAAAESQRQAQIPTIGVDDIQAANSDATVPDSTSKREIDVAKGGLSDNEKESRKPTTTKTNPKRKRFKPIMRTNTKIKSQQVSNQGEVAGSTPLTAKQSSKQTSESQPKVLPKRIDESGSAATAAAADPPPPHHVPPKETRYVFRESSSSDTARSSTTKSAKTPRVPPPRSRKRKQDQFNLRYSNEDALEAQERLFREAAARVRAQAHIRVASANSHSTTQQRPCFNNLVADVATRYPDHWEYTDYFARLGLPKGAPLQSIKLQYRKLVLIYHPDKSKDERASTKFQAITEAYRSLVGR